MDSKTADITTSGPGPTTAVEGSEPALSAVTSAGAAGRVIRPSRLSPNLASAGGHSPPRSPPSPTAAHLQTPPPPPSVAVKHTDPLPVQSMPQQASKMPPATSAACAKAGNKDTALDTDASEDAEPPEELEDYDEADSILDQQQLPWYRTRKLLVVLVMAISVIFVLAGLLVQLTAGDDEPPSFASWDSARKAFPWLHFFSAFFPLSFSLHWLCWRLYKVAEWTAIREELYFLRPLRSKLASLLFWVLVLAWYQVCFKCVWCTDEGCAGEAYQQALHVVWKLLICFTLFFGANFLKCGLARLLSYQFYRTAHFMKVKEAIERELYLIRLSQARSSLVPTPPAPSPAVPGTGVHSQVHPHAGVTHWLAEKGSMIWQKGSFVLTQRRRASTAADADVGPGGLHRQPAAHMPDAVEPEVTAVVNVKSGSTSLDTKQQLQQLQQLHRQHADAAVEEDVTPMLPEVDPHSGGLRGNMEHAAGASSGHHHKGQRNGSSSSNSSKHKPSAEGLAVRSREPSFEQFLATRMPSLLGPGQHVGSGGRLGSRTGLPLPGIKSSSRGSAGSRTSLVNMVPGVDGLLLQPEVLEVTATTKQSVGGKAQPMTEQELLAMRKALGVNSFGAFVDRYYGLSAKEEAAHVKHVKRFAKGLFHNIKGDADRDFLLPRDFLLFFDGDAESAEDAFNYFDRNGDGSISCSELQDSAADMLCERKNIAASIKDTDSVVDSLETGMGLLIHFIWLIFYLLVWGVNIVKGFTTFSTTVLALTFVFGDSVKSVFESALFLFLEHPYDVGDTLVMAGGVLCKVKKIDLMYTVLLQGTGEMVWHPNYSMRSAVLINLSRSGNKWEGFSWLVDLNTPDEVLDTMRAAMKAHMIENPTHFKGDPVVTWRGLEEPFKMRLYVGWGYSFTGEDVRRHRIARFGMLKVVKEELHRVGVTYTLPLTPAAAPYLTKQLAQ